MQRKVYNYIAIHICHLFTKFVNVSGGSQKFVNRERIPTLLMINTFFSKILLNHDHVYRIAPQIYRGRNGGTCVTTAKWS